MGKDVIFTALEDDQRPEIGKPKDIFFQNRMVEDPEPESGWSATPTDETASVETRSSLRSSLDAMIADGSEVMRLLSATIGDTRDPGASLLAYNKKVARERELRIALKKLEKLYRAAWKKDRDLEIWTREVDRNLE